MLLVALVTFVGSPGLDTTGLVLSIVFVVAFGACELVRAQQNRRLLERLAGLAGRDPLTGVRNRRALSERLDELAGGRPSSRSSDSGWWFLTLDLDGFKDVNDMLGHETGDLVLQLVAKALEDHVGNGGADVFRLGGDEFGVLASGTETEVRELAESLLVAVSRSVRGVPGVARLDVLGQHRGRPAPARHRHPRHAGGHRRVGAGDAPGQAGRPRSGGRLQRAARGAQPTAPADGAPAARHHRGRRRRRALPAGLRRVDGLPHRRRGAGPVERPRPGRRQPGRVHRGRGGVRAHRRDGPADHAQGAAADGRLRRRGPRRPGRGQRLDDPAARPVLRRASSSRRSWRSASSRPRSCSR